MWIVWGILSEYELNKSSRRSMEERPSRLTKGMFSSTTDLWATPQDFFDKLNEEFHFDLDPCALAENAKCERFFTPDIDGLKQDWGGVFCILQPSIRQSHCRMGKEMPRRGAEARYKGCNADTGENRHILFSRLHLPQSRVAFHSWPS